MLALRHQSAWYTNALAVTDRKAIYLSKIVILWGPHQNIAITLGTEKLEWYGYPMVKNIKDMFTYFDRMYKRDRRRMTA